MKTYDIVIESTNPIDFISRVSLFAAGGAKPREDFYPKLKSLPMMARMNIEIDKDPEEVFGKIQGVTYIPVITTYTKQQLDGMSWEAFKRVLNLTGISGRDRNVMTTKYLSLGDKSKEPVVNTVVNTEVEEKPKASPTKETRRKENKHKVVEKTEDKTTDTPTTEEK